MPPTDPKLRLLVRHSESPQDVALAEELLLHLRHLKRFAGIDVWSEARVLPGDSRRHAVQRAIDAADVALLLLSSSFLASDGLLDDEVPHLLERHRRGKLRVIPVVLRSCLWEVHPWLSELKPVPRAGRAIGSFAGDARDEILAEVAREIMALAPPTVPGAPPSFIAPQTPMDPDLEPTLLEVHYGEVPPGSVPPPRPVAGQLRIGLPQSLAGLFIGREPMVAALHRALRSGRVALRSAEVRPGHVSAHGGGGIGKSRLAIEYAHRYASEYPGGIFFTVAGARAPLAIWAEFAREAALRRPGLFGDNLDRDDHAALAFARWLDDPAPGYRLLVLDDVSGSEADDLSRRFAPCEVRGTTIWPLSSEARANVLFTTRLRDLPDARAIPVHALAPDDARKLLLARSTRPKLDQAEREHAHLLASRILGGHPLAIALAGAYLRKVGPGYTFADYTEEVKKKGTILALEEAAMIAGHKVVDHEKSILVTYELSRSLLDRDDPIDALASRILALTACLAPNVAIDRGFIGRLLAQEGEPADKRDVGLGTERLLDLSLLSPAPERAEQGDVVIHLLVAEYTGSVMGEAERRRVLAAAVDTVRGLFPSHHGDFWKVSRADAHYGWDWLSPPREIHALEVWARSASLATRARGRLGIGIGDLRMARGELAQALLAYREARAVLTARPEYGDPHGQRELCVAHERVGDVLMEQRDLAGALREYRQAMEIRRTLVGADPESAQLQRDLLVSHHKLGNVLAAQRDPPAALVEFRAALAIADHLVRRDPTHVQWQRDLSVSYTRVGSVHKAQGDATAALGEYRTAMQIRERLTRQEPANPGHQLDLSKSHIKIGGVLEHQGHAAEAVVEYGRANEIRERLVGQDPHNASWRGDLAYSMFRLASSLPPPSPEARSYLERARGIYADLNARSLLTLSQQQTLLDIERKLEAPSRT